MRVFPVRIQFTPRWGARGSWTHCSSSYTSHLSVTHCTGATVNHTSFMNLNSIPHLATKSFSMAHICKTQDRRESDYSVNLLRINIYLEWWKSEPVRDSNLMFGAVSSGVTSWADQTPWKMAKGLLLFKRQPCVWVWFWINQCWVDRVRDKMKDVLESILNPLALWSLWKLMQRRCYEPAFMLQTMYSGRC